MMKQIILFFVIIICFFYSFAQDKKYNNTDPVDKDFNELFELFNSNPDADNPIKRFAIKERRIMLFRDWGIKLWDLYPNDERRYEWFRNCFTGVSGYQNYHYWKNIDSAVCQYMSETYMSKFLFTSYSAPIDFSLLGKHEKKYPRMRSAYFGYLEKNKLIGSEERDRLKNAVYVNELESFLKLCRNIEYRRGEKINLKRLKQLFISASAYLDTSANYVFRPWHSDVLRAMDNDFMSCYKEYGLIEADIKEFLTSLEDVRQPYVRKWLNQRTSLLALMNTPFELKHETIDGHMIDLDQMRGKVVLLDFWATTCGGCIKRMPAIKQVYDKYKHQGFQVLSICINVGDETEAIKRVEKKIGADWPIMAVGGTTKEDSPSSLGAGIFKKYGFYGVPQLLLLNKRGELVLLNDILRNGDFEPIVQKLLSEKI